MSKPVLVSCYRNQEHKAGPCPILKVKTERARNCNRVGAKPSKQQGIYCRVIRYQITIHKVIYSYVAGMSLKMSKLLQWQLKGMRSDRVSNGL